MDKHEKNREMRLISHEIHAATKLGQSLKAKGELTLAAEAFAKAERLHKRRSKLQESL